MEILGNIKIFGTASETGSPLLPEDLTTKGYVDTRFADFYRNAQGGGGGAGGLTSVSDGIRTYSSPTILGFDSQHFYVSAGSLAAQVIINLRQTQDLYKGHLPGVIVDNFFLEPDAEHAFTVQSASFDTRSGTATLGFYIVSSSNYDLPGKAITGMDRLTASTTRSGATATALNTMQVGDRLVMSVFGVASAEHLTYTVRLRKT